VDPRLHHLQGKTELVTDTLALLQQFYGEKLAMLLRHEAASRAVSQYDQNNTYQFIVNRDETHLSWVGKAIEDMGGATGDDGETGGALAGRGADAARAAIAEDGRDAQAFVERWKPRVEQMTDARHAKMLRVILGEILEQKRFFDQALAGRTDLLGRRADVLGPSHGEVLPTRWIE
jgi:hypothetical protein